jgi:hypothetical protein
MAVTLVPLAVLAAPAAAQDAGETSSQEEGEAQITDKQHPDYTVCRTKSVIGSRAKKRRVCLTNREWARVAREGRSLASAMAEKNSSGLITN